jgi:hypothetical protein
VAKVRPVAVAATSRIVIAIRETVVINSSSRCYVERGMVMGYLKSLKGLVDKRVR